MHYRYWATIICLLPILNTCFCQNQSEDDQIFENMRVEIIETSFNNPAKITLPFTNVEVLDCRPDTTMIGFYETPLKRFLKLNFKNGLSGLTNDFLLNNYGFQSDLQSPGLLLCIKNFWASTAIEVGSEDITTNEFTKGIIVKVDAYTRFGNLYQPLARVEFNYLLAAINKSNIKEIIEVVLKAAMKEILAKTDKLKQENKQLKRAQIESFNSAANSIPILSDTHLVRGVYNSFKEFKMNQPASRAFEVQNGRLGDMVFVKDAGGQEAPERNAWGYCDGKKIFMKMSDKFYELHRCGQTFNVFGAIQLTRRRNIKAGNVLLLGLAAGAVGSQNKKTTYYLLDKPYQLEMNNGEVY